MSYRSTRKGLPVKPRHRRGFGFHWYGRDDQGVSIWTGDPQALKLGSRILGSIGPTLLVASLIALVVGGPIEAVGIMALVGTIHTSIAFMMRRQRLGIEALSTVEQASTDLGLNLDRVDAFITESGIKPRVIINGEAYFNPVDLGAAATLLRAVQPPSPNSLLRPAANANVDSAKLLQASSSEPHETIIVQKTS